LRTGPLARCLIAYMPPGSLPHCPLAHCLTAPLVRCLIAFITASLHLGSLPHCLYASRLTASLSLGSLPHCLYAPLTHYTAISRPSALLHHCLADLSLLRNKMHRCLLLIPAQLAHSNYPQLPDEGPRLSTLIRGGGGGAGDLITFYRPTCSKNFASVSHWTACST
jgi:hypothetical protein